MITVKNAKQNFAIIIFMMMFCIFLLFKKNVLGQSSLNPDAAISICNDGQHSAQYIKFKIDMLGAVELEQQLTDLVITTNYGDIKFNESFDASEATRFAESNLYLNEFVDEIVFIKSTGKLNGKFVDLTNNLNPIDNIPVPMKLKPSNGINITQGTYESDEKDENGTPLIIFKISANGEGTRFIAEEGYDVPTRWEFIGQNLKIEDNDDEAPEILTWLMKVISSTEMQSPDGMKFKLVKLIE
jgi:hypothetical protein